MRSRQYGTVDFDDIVKEVEERTKAEKARALKCKRALNYEYDGFFDSEIYYVNSLEMFDTEFIKVDTSEGTWYDATIPDLDFETIFMDNDIPFSFEDIPDYIFPEFNPVNDEIPSCDAILCNDNMYDAAIYDQTVLKETAYIETNIKQTMCNDTHCNPKEGDVSEKLDFCNYIPSIAEVCNELPSFVEICNKFPDIAEVCNNVPSIAEFSNIPSGSLEVSNVSLCPNPGSNVMSGSIEVCNNVPSIAAASNVLPCITTVTNGILGIPDVYNSPPCVKSDCNNVSDIAELCNIPPCVTTVCNHAHTANEYVAGDQFEPRMQSADNKEKSTIAERISILTRLLFEPKVVEVKFPEKINIEERSFVFQEVMDVFRKGICK
ncbi:hypothetical protein GINT2_002121 [Glugoides intestinalis]